MEMGKLRKTLKLTARERERNKNSRSSALDVEREDEANATSRPKSKATAQLSEKKSLALGCWSICLVDWLDFWGKLL